MFLIISILNTPIQMCLSLCTQCYTPIATCLSLCVYCYLSIAMYLELRAYLLPSKSTVGMPLSLHAYVYTSTVVPITTCLSLLASNQAGCSTESFRDKTLLRHSPLGPHGPSNSLLLSKSAIGMPLSLHAYLYTSTVVPITTCLSLLAYR